MAAALTGFPLGSESNLGDVDSVARMPVGTVIGGVDALGNFAEYVYLQGVASVIVGTVVTFDHLGVTTLIAANAVGPVAVAVGLIVALKFGWFGRTGTFLTDVVANSAAGAGIGRETTDGKVGDGFAAGDQIFGAVQRVATTAAAVVYCSFDRPYVGNTA